jgi:NADH dehydrogenase
MNLVIGATGMVGTEVCRALVETGKPATALVRPSAEPVKVRSLEALGVTIVRGDLRDRASLDAACQGARTVITTASAMPFAYAPGENTPERTDREGCISLIDAARGAGVHHFVYISFPPMSAAFPLQDAKRAVEAHLRSSGMTYTVLRPTYFTEVWLSPAVGFEAANRKATLYGNGDKGISWISFRDVARFAVASLDAPAARNATLELGGPEALSPNEVVAIFERVGGGVFEVTHVPVESIQAQWSAAVDPMEKSFAGLMLGYADGAPIDMTDTLKTFPLRLTSVTEYARHLVSKG